MLGSYAVGKTSLVQRFVNSIFSEKYQTTIGVKIDQKIVKANNEIVNLLLWDIYGEDMYQKIKPAYIMGASGYFIVIDGTRLDTLKIGFEIKKMAEGIAGEVPCIFLINKVDLKDEWEITDDDIAELRNNGQHLFLTSAKEDLAVEDAFMKLTELMLK